MNEEEKQAVEWLRKQILVKTDKNTKITVVSDILLGLIDRQQKEIQLKDKVINEMAEYISNEETYIANRDNVSMEFERASKEYITNSFTNKVKEEM